ncbi:hypothetical protein [Photobacterium sanctipauli]|uniref:hypothetical protein n=1 Tax=Photobacterium sanctipauli TaxID=1342794 RepID=UPI000ADA6CB4|nr:hypothetical protein [Photobacterium sanctipauli]
MKSGHGFVIPFDCLHAITVLPGTIYSKVDFSARITSPVCKEAGFFRKNPLINAVIDELIKCQARDNETPLSGASGNLLRVLADQIGSLKVNTKSTSPELAAKYQPVLACMLKGDSVTDKTACSTIEQYLGYSIKELKTCVVMREALRLARSGRKPHQIAETLKTDESLLVAMAQPILGHAL